MFLIDCWTSNRDTICALPRRHRLLVMRLKLQQWHQDGFLEMFLHLLAHWYLWYWLAKLFISFTGSLCRWNDHFRVDQSQMSMDGCQRLQRYWYWPAPMITRSASSIVTNLIWSILSEPKAIKKMRSHVREGINREGESFSCLLVCNQIKIHLIMQWTQKAVKLFSE